MSIIKNKKNMIENENGITVKELKEFIKNLPEKDEFGEDYEVWFIKQNGLSYVCKKIIRLNESDIALSL